MFVTSDIFDLKAIGDYRDFDWQENLLGGVVVHGASWRGYQSAAGYMLEVAERCGLVDELRYASYGRPGDERQHFIKPTSFARLAQGKLKGASDADHVLLKGERPASGSRRESLLFGGEASGRPRWKPKGSSIALYPYQAIDGHFCFPIDEHPHKTGSDILRLAVEKLDVEYGYYFLRDDLCAPGQYFSAFAAPLDLGRLQDDDAQAHWDWYQYVREGRIWTDPFPLLRDLYEVNLISERHTSVRTSGLGHVTDWITAEAGRGRLEHLGRGRLLWTLTDQEMFDVRPVLNEAGLLKSCRDRIYRDLHPGTGVKPYADPRCYPPMLWRPSRDRAGHA